MSRKPNWNPKPSRRAARVLEGAGAQTKRSFIKTFRKNTFKELTAEFQNGPALGARQENPTVIMALHVLLAGVIAAAPAKAYERVVKSLMHQCE